MQRYFYTIKKILTPESQIVWHDGNRVTGNCVSATYKMRMKCYLKGFIYWKRDNFHCNVSVPVVFKRLLGADFSHHQSILHHHRISSKTCQGRFILFILSLFIFILVGGMKKCFFSFWRWYHDSAAPLERFSQQSNCYPQSVTIDFELDFINHD